MLLLKKIILVVLPVAIVAGGVLAKDKLFVGKSIVKQLSAAKADIHEGDIIFQISESELSTAIQLATHSKYSHCGIIFKEKDDQLYVYEALQPVRFTPLATWIARGKDKHFVIKRLKNAGTVITPSVIDKMKEAGKRFDGKDYDFYFGWSDERMYCSELVWKIYKEATGLEVGVLQPLKDFDLSSAPVKKKMKEIYGDHIPATEKIISPVSMFNSPLLVTVMDDSTK
ncbi:permuted papain-like amidase YaeF/Yiix C92 family enzyme [Chitinophaga niastensis]|uniref:Permuted papain-like amidase YaeF/Yiix C92 family enzyme n=1 Tax=Chitinophaga niastensis TaxID=536980 RepID=A0A2P8HA49_CHINA|nr:YiiX family permuted papain-like enzyme [Chitinophaga niastensis]PSL43092.1 permuted papain-like amidase YaeF/Yiix C92 family enzyme [Chitinophaga niastensis]